MASMTHVQRVRLVYKTILKLHRSLPEEAKAIGDQYVKDEFKRHKTCQPPEVNIFMKEWADYAVTLAKQLAAYHTQQNVNSLGHQLSREKLEQFTDEQLFQLYELMQEATKPILHCSEQEAIPKT